VGLDIAFWILAVVGVASALAVVLLHDVFRAALSLVVCFIAVAGIYASLSADFLAVVQILVYVGAISILMILGIMLTRDIRHGSPSNKLRLPALVAAVLFLAVVAFAVFNTDWQVVSSPVLGPTTAGLADRLFGDGGYVLAVEIAGGLLLAAVLGAIVLVREK
jgi:NADH-quinone oxidoreductase subunit J